MSGPSSNSRASRSVVGVLHDMAAPRKLGTRCVFTVFASLLAGAPSAVGTAVGVADSRLAQFNEEVQSEEQSWSIQQIQRHRQDLPATAGHANAAHRVESPLLRREPPMSKEEEEAKEAAFQRFQASLRVERGTSQALAQDRRVVHPDTHSLGPIRHPGPQHAAQLMQQSEGNNQHTEDGLKLVATPPFMFVGVMSPVGRRQQRDVIRRTWMQHVMLTRKGSRHESVARFVVPVAAGSPAEAALEKESQDHGDIVQLPVKDQDGAVQGQWAMAFLRWFSQNRPERFVMKLDDDTYPQLGRIVNLVHTSPASQNVYLGRMARCQKSGSVEHAPYMAAGGCVMSRSLVEKIGNISNTDDSKDLQEGQSIGRWVKSANASLADRVFYLALPARDHYSLENSAKGCKESDALTFGMSSEEIECMWKQQGQVGGICCKSSSRAPFGASGVLLAAAAQQEQLGQDCPLEKIWTV